MKIRTGFVSNSSSSSFCIFGSMLEKEDFIMKVFGKIYIEMRGCNCQIPTGDKFCSMCGKMQWIRHNYTVEDAVDKFNEKHKDVKAYTYGYNHPLIFVGFEIEGLSSEKMITVLTHADEITSITGLVPVVHCGEYET